jgi:hypothetical protein
MESTYGSNNMMSLCRVVEQSATIKDIAELNIRMG